MREIKIHFNNIIKNRINSTKRIKHLLHRSNTTKYIMHIQNNNANYFNYPCYNMLKEKNNLRSSSQTIKISNDFHNTDNNFFSSSSSTNKQKKIHNTIENIVENNDKNIIKEKLIIKLKQDQEEKERIKDEIVKIEQEELLLLNQFRNNFKDE